MAMILAVDDRSTNRDFLVTLLTYRGHRVLQAAEVLFEPRELLVGGRLLVTHHQLLLIQLLRAARELVLSIRQRVFFLLTSAHAGSRLCFENRRSGSGVSIVDFREGGQAGAVASPYLRGVEWFRPPDGRIN